MSEIFYVVPEEQHNALVAAAYKKRGYSSAEAEAGARFCAEATRHGIRTHNGLKALHLDHLFGSGAGGCQPKAKIEKVKTRFRGAAVWNANRKLGQATGYAAIETAIKLADKYGVGMVSVDNAFHYAGRGHTVTVSLDGTADEVILAVEDDGPGVDEAFLDQLGERFFRVPGGDQDGTGLGLAIVESIAERHAARVAFKRGAMAGLRVELHFPAPLTGKPGETAH